MSEYAEFLARKTVRVEKPGHTVTADDVHPMLHPWQNETPGPQHYIYGLYDPITGELRYIGKSDRPRERLANQLNERADTHRCHWMQSLVAQGLRPIQRIIDSVPIGGDWQTVERAYIAGARVAGCKLTNGTDGGDGVPGLSPEARERIRAAWLGRKHSPETLLKLSAASRGRKHTAVWRENMRALMTGREFSAKHRQRLQRAVQKLTPKQVRAIRRMLAMGIQQREIARHFGIHQGSVSNLARGKTYVGIGLEAELSAPTLFDTADVA